MTEVAVLQALALKPHNSSSTGTSCCPSTGAQDERLQVSEPVCRPFKSTPGFPTALHLTQMCGILADFHSQIL